MPSFLEERTLNIKHSDEKCTPILSVSALKSAFSVILHTGPELLLSFTDNFVICAKVYVLECEWLILSYMEAANPSVNSHMEDQGWQFLLSVPKWC